MNDLIVKIRMQKLIDAFGSQKDLASYLGVTKSYVSNVLHGRQPPSKTLLKELGLRKVRKVTITYEPAASEES